MKRIRGDDELDDILSSFGPADEEISVTVQTDAEQRSARPVQSDLTNKRKRPSAGHDSGEKLSNPATDEHLDASKAIWNPLVTRNFDYDELSERSSLFSVTKKLQFAVEMKRRNLLNGIRARFRDTCQTYGISAPAVALEEWLYSQPDAASTSSRAGNESENGRVASLLGHLQTQGATLKAARKISQDLLKTCHQASSKLSKEKSRTGASNAASKVLVQFQGSMVSLSFYTFECRLTREHYHKLYALFLRNATGIEIPENKFHEYLAMMLLRYESLENGGYQAALNEEVFDVLLQEFDCRMECFASPVNCRYEQYCSMFGDIDAAFGSCGDFFKFHPTSGCFEANPPFVPELVSRMGERIEHLLSSTNLPLSFIVIVPAWKNVPEWKALHSSRWKTHSLEIPQAEHGFCEGKQHRRKNRWRISTCNTSVIFLQNKEGSKKYKVQEQQISAIKKAFRLKHDSDVKA